nr:unnamed protein product [Callosobruchus analis]
MGIDTTLGTMLVVRARRGATTTVRPVCASVQGHPALRCQLRQEAGHLDLRGIITIIITPRPILVGSNNTMCNIVIRCCLTTVEDGEVREEGYHPHLVSLPLFN